MDLASDLSAADLPYVGAGVLTEIMTELALPDQHEDQIAWQEGKRYVARLERYHVNRERRDIGGMSVERNPQTLQIHAHRTYLITGGLGGLGIPVSQWLVEQGARHLVLVGRSEPSPTAHLALQRFAQLGAAVTVAQADVADFAAIEGVFAAIPAEFPLAGVIHAAGVLDDGILRQQNWSRFATVLAAKVQGAWHLHQLTQRLPLDFFVLFSSDTSLLGNGGQANHAAANAFLDGLAHYRQAQGLVALSINWGAWAEIGAAAQRNIAAQIERKGMGLITPEQGIAALAALLNRARTPSIAQVGVTSIDWSKFLPPAAPPSPFLRYFKQKVTKPVAKQTMQQQLHHAADPYALLTELTLDLVTQTLGWSSSAAVGVEQGFFELGMDSLMSLELRRRLQSSLDCELPSTLAFTYPSVKALVDYLAKVVLKLERSTPIVSTVSTQVAPTFAQGMLTGNGTSAIDDKQLERWVEELSDNEVGTLLDEKLDQLDAWLA
jgi:NAD(P)-dependent dehydrogenase (short-subunit alcohol dehydrogenase family)/acyl carrier protein